MDSRPTRNQWYLLCVFILIERGELDEWAIRLDRCPLVEADD